MVLGEALDILNPKSIGEIEGRIGARRIPLPFQAFRNENQGFLYFKFTFDLTLGHQKVVLESLLSIECYNICKCGYQKAKEEKKHCHKVRQAYLVLIATVWFYGGDQ